MAQGRQDGDLVGVLYDTPLVARRAAGQHDLGRHDLAAPEAAEDAREAALADLGGCG